MRYKLLGSSGLRVSEICLGTLTFGESKSWGTRSEDAVAIINAFAQAGGNVIDTAPNYGGGASEEIVGKALEGRRDDFVISTKYTASPVAKIAAGGNSKRSMALSVERSLKRLNTDRIDIFWLHYWDATAPLDEILRGIDDLSSSGKILYFGISDTPAWLISRADLLTKLRGTEPVTAVQVEYNVAARSVERELLPMAEALELGVFCWGPLASGALSGGGDPQRRKAGTLSPSLNAAKDRFLEIAALHNVRPVVAALRWLMQRGKSLIPIVGARRLEHLSEIIAACDTHLPSQMLVEMDEISPVELGFPHDVLRLSYLRNLALGEPDKLDMPARARS